MTSMGSSSSAPWRWSGVVATNWASIVAIWRWRALNCSRGVGDGGARAAGTVFEEGVFEEGEVEDFSSREVAEEDGGFLAWSALRARRSSFRRCLSSSSRLCGVEVSLLCWRRVLGTSVELVVPVVIAPSWAGLIGPNSRWMRSTELDPAPGLEPEVVGPDVATPGGAGATEDGADTGLGEPFVESRVEVFRVWRLEACRGGLSWRSWRSSSDGSASTSMAGSPGVRRRTSSAESEEDALEDEVDDDVLVLEPRESLEGADIAVLKTRLFRRINGG